MATIKFTGVQFRGFLDHLRDSGFEIEGSKLKVNGQPADIRNAADSVILDTDRVELKGGTVTEGIDGGAIFTKAELAARAWLRDQTHVVMQVSVPREFAMDLHSELAGRGFAVSTLGM
jgi:hypothetical protein